MKGRRPFARKIIYFCGIAVALVPLSYISRPSTTEKEGGVLARMRSEYNLSQASLGEIDPAGASMSLATLGLRGVAVNQLWMYANKSKMRENYDGVRLATHQITKLQPNFLSVWLFQAHNLSYNISVEFDDYRHRYHWVKKGIDYLVEGTHYNRDQPRLMTELGWFCGHKFGRSDEYVQFRRLFREDVDFHQFFEDQANVDMTETNGPDQRPDSWLLAHWWYSKAVQTVDTKNAPIAGRSPVLFFSDPPKSLMDYANAIEEEGYLDEKGQEAWRIAGRAWSEYGDRSIPTTRNFDIRLNDLDRAREIVDSTWSRLEELVPGIRQGIENKKRAALPEDQQKAMDKAPRDRNNSEEILAETGFEAIRVTPQEVANAAPEGVRYAARELVEAAAHEEEVAEYIEHYRQVVNFNYWKTRCEAEQQDVAIRARRHLLNATELFDQTALQQAREEFEKSFEAWAELYERYPGLSDDIDAEILLERIVQYQVLLSRMEIDFPPPGFPLLKFINSRSASHSELVEDEFGAVNIPKPSTGNAPAGAPAEVESGGSEPENAAQENSAVESAEQDNTESSE
jgi:hypothetical protein